MREFEKPNTKRIAYIRSLGIIKESGVKEKDYFAHVLGVVVAVPGCVLRTCSMSVQFTAICGFLG